MDVLITTCGRNLYLNRLAQSIQQQSFYDVDAHRFIVYFNDTPPRKLFPNQLTIHSKERVSINSVMEHVKGQIQHELFFKLDEDALLCSPDFFSKVEEIHNLEKKAIFSPFPVGLINNLGGPQSNERKVIYGSENDSFYTLRKVSHVGGFARIMPSEYLKNLSFEEGHSEDGIISEWARTNNIPMYYLENSLIVEHQESTLGQHERYKNYFGERF